MAKSPPARLRRFHSHGHCDCEYSANSLVFENITASFDAAVSVRSGYADTLRIAAGAEVGDALFDPLFAEKVLKARQWDVILGSVHAVRFGEWSMPFSCIDFSDKSDRFITEYLYAYFTDAEEMLDKTDFDVLSHLTVPLRYFIKKTGRSIDVERYYPQIENILRKTVASGKTLEINTSNYSPVDPFFMPDERVVYTSLNYFISSLRSLLFIVQKLLRQRFITLPEELIRLRILFSEQLIRCRSRSDFPLRQN